MVLWKELTGIPRLTQVLQTLRMASIELPMAGSAEAWAKTISSTAQEARTGFGYAVNSSEQAECNEVARVLDSVAASLMRDNIRPLNTQDYVILAKQVVTLLDMLDPNWQLKDEAGQHYESYRRMFWD